MKRSKHLSNKGFTIIELLVATTIFSVVLLVCSVALLQISRSFYKGITVTKTQEVARNVLDDITMSVEFSAGTIQTLSPNNGSQGYCVGNTRYSYRLGTPVTESGSSHALVVDRPASCSGAAQDLLAPLSADSKELLAPRMRVAKFSITPVAGTSRLHQVNIRIVAGDNDLLIDPTGPNARCSGVLAGSQFCTAIELTTTIQKRVQ